MHSFAHHQEALYVYTVPPHDEQIKCLKYVQNINHTKTESKQCILVSPITLTGY
jgi:hypothetical protein